MMWLRVWLFGAPDPEEARLVKDLEDEKRKFNGAIERLEKEAGTIKRDGIDKLLDDALRTVDRKRPSL